MVPPDLSEPDDILNDLLGAIFGADSWIVWLVVIITFLTAWYGLAMWVSKKARAAGQRVASIPAARRGRAIALTLLAAAGQVFYLLVSYCIATFIPYVADNMKQDASEAPINVASWLSDLPAAPTDRALFWVWLVVALGVAATGWVRATGTFGGISPFEPPIWFLLSCGGVAILTFFVLAHGMKLDAAKGAATWESTTRMYSFAWLALIYTILAVVAVYVPKACAKAWSSPAATERGW